MIKAWAYPTLINCCLLWGLLALNDIFPRNLICWLATTLLIAFVTVGSYYTGRQDGEHKVLTKYIEELERYE